MMRRGDALLELPVEEVGPGDVVALRPGDRVPLDGSILRGAGNELRGKLPRPAQAAEGPVAAVKEILADVAARGYAPDVE